ncbi:MAG: hypothetical protein WA323_02115 [Candidatus Nitrosopolaris sp.]
MSLAVNGVILVARCFILIARNTDAIAITTPTANIMLNAAGLGQLFATLSTVIETVTDARITVVITGPIAPPTILIIFVAAEEIPVYSLGVNEVIVLINVIGNNAPAIPNKKRPPLIDCDVKWNNKSNTYEIAAIIMPGTNNFKLSPFFLTIINRLEKLKVNIMKTGQDPRDNQPSHCSRNDNDATSCYNLGHDAGYASAKKRLPHLGF